MFVKTALRAARRTLFGLQKTPNVNAMFFKNVNAIGKRRVKKRTIGVENFPPFSIYAEK